MSADTMENQEKLDALATFVSDAKRMLNASQEANIASLEAWASMEELRIAGDNTPESHEAFRVRSRIFDVKLHALIFLHYKTNQIVESLFIPKARMGEPGTYMELDVERSLSLCQWVPPYEAE